MLLKINHLTEYHYSEPQRMIVQSHRLYPSDCSIQEINDWNVSCEGANFGDYFHDGAGDCMRTMSINSIVESVKIKISGEVTTSENNGIVVFNRDLINPLVYLRSSPTTQPSDALMAAAQDSIKPVGSNGLDQAHAMTDFINDKIKYIPGSTDSSNTAAEVILQGQGVCQDQTHCLVTLARINQIPARYVTGYLHTDADGQQHDASHAWAELFISDLGWVGFDATNVCCPDERYVRIGSGIDAQDAALIRGISRGSGSESMKTSVKISGMQQ